ncbi:hypothetical protein [Archangium violaceum]|uniref:hypothetical protein n=1 Tax=Archangium violaceum TaxID=83451 RepID=UPI0036DDB0A2
MAISLEGALDYARGYGMSNLEYDVPITPDSIFHVASLSNQVDGLTISTHRVRRLRAQRLTAADAPAPRTGKSTAKVRDR